MSVFSKNTRMGRFFRTLSSSYVLLLAATVYSLGVVPIILTYTDTRSLGLWTLVVQFGTYLTLLDAGLSAACIRQFVGPMVRKDSDELASKFQNALVLASAQGALIALTGLAGSLLVPWLSIPAEQAQLFAALFAVQCCLVALEFPLRPFNALLLAQQRFEFNYLATALGMVVSLGLVWLGMENGLGLWSLILAGALQALVKTSTSLVCVARFYGFRGFFSACQVRLHAMHQLLAESSSFFSGTLFGTLGGVAQATLLSRWFGLEGVAAWSVGSKAANLLSQLLSKFYESSFAGLSELFESGRRDLLIRRLGQLFGWVIGISISVASGICLFNEAFIRIWTSARIGWPGNCDVGMALWLVGLTASRGFAEQAKILLVWRWIRLGPACEFFSWLVLGLVLSHFFSFSGYVWSVALAPWLSSILIYGLGLRRQYANSGITLISKEASALAWAGTGCLGMAAVLTLQNTSFSLRLVLAGFVIFAFVWLAIIPLRNLLASWHQKSGLSS
jgi:O-antigen/teichoic acid export membrane protein